MTTDTQIKVTLSTPQLERLYRSKKVQILEQIDDNTFAIQGSENQVYLTTKNICTCPDQLKNPNLICKHRCKVLSIARK